MKRFSLSGHYRTLSALLMLALSGMLAVAQESPRSAATPAASAEVKAARPPWGRILLVGASASAGFTESEPLGGPNTAQYRLSRYVDAALLAPHERVRNLASTMFFLQPDAEGRRQIDQALQAKPTLVVGLDFLFWFCYGDGSTDAERLQRFEQGLKLLEAVHCPLILGDIPDASGALVSMLPPELIPSAAAMSAANRRLKQWAATRKHVVVVPLSAFMHTVVANQALTVRGHTWPAGKTRALLQSDKLHPSASGCVVLALTVFDAFLSRQPALSASEIRWDPKEVFQLASKPSQGTPKPGVKVAMPPVSAEKWRK